MTYLSRPASRLLGATAVVLLVGVAAGCGDSGARSTGDATPGAGDPTGVVETGGADENSAGGEYDLVEELCEAADFTPVFDIMPLDYPLDDHIVDDPWYTRMSCIFSLAGDQPQQFGYLVASATVLLDAEQASDVFGQRAEEEVGQVHDGTLAGVWDEDVTFDNEMPFPDESEVFLLLRDGALLLGFRLTLSAADAGIDGQQAALEQVAESMREVLRQ